MSSGKYKGVRFYYPNGIGKNNSTDVVGVYRRMKKMRSGKRYPYYTSTVHIKKGQPVTRAMSVEKWGEATAFLRMCEWRREKLKEIYPDKFDEEHFNQSVIKYLKKLEL